MADANLEVPSVLPDARQGIAIGDVSPLMTPRATQLFNETADRLQFSNFIGQRWEEMCVGFLQKLVASPDQAQKHLDLDPGHEIGAVIALDTDAKVKREAHGLKVPDALVVVLNPSDKSSVMLRAVDYKFNLTRAHYDQVSAQTLSDLFIQSPQARTVVEAAINNLKAKGRLDGDFVLATKKIIDLSHREYMPLDAAQKIRGKKGRFISPDTKENRAFLQGSGKRLREVVCARTLENEEIVFLLAGAPGQTQELIIERPSEEAGLTEEAVLNELDIQLLKAKISATMTVRGGIRTIDDLNEFLRQPDKFPFTVEKRVKVRFPPKGFFEQFGKRLGDNTQKVRAVLKEISQLEPGEKMLTLRVRLDEFSIPADLREEIIAFCFEQPENG